MRTIIRTVVVAALVAALAAVTTTAGAAGARKDHGTAWLGINHAAGGLQIASGDIDSALFGHGAIVYRVTALPAPNGTFKVTSKSVTLFTTRGTLSGTGSATQTLNPDGTGTVTDGHIKLTKGTGKLRGHSFVATFSGPLQDGVYTFTYQGTFR
ncbi:MAG TPA: hypothetical protein VFT50_16570 [Baekduia sp.]|nr:hypothetical protein [Baekduia sp.]